MALRVGDGAPDFELENHKRERVRLSNFRDRQNVLLVFHPLAFTPVCHDEFCSIQQQWERFQELNTHVLGISVDSSAAKAAWARALGGVSFDLLSDFHPHGEVSRTYGVFREDTGFSERAIFLVDRAGKIAFARTYGIPESPTLDDLFATLQELNSQAGRS